MNTPGDKAPDGEDPLPWTPGDTIGRSFVTLDDLRALLYAPRAAAGFEALARARQHGAEEQDWIERSGAGRSPFTSEVTGRTRHEFGVRQTERRVWLERREYRSFALVAPSSGPDIILSVGYDEANPGPDNRQQIRLTPAEASYLAERLLMAAAGRWSFGIASDPGVEMEDVLKPRGT